MVKKNLTLICRRKKLRAEDEAEDVAEDEGEEAMAKVAKAKEEALQFLQGEG